MKAQMVKIDHIRLQKLRTENKYSLSQLANVCNCSRQYIHSIENGKHEKIAKFRLLQLADFLGCTPDYLQGDVQDKNEIIHSKDANGQPHILKTVLTKGLIQDQLLTNLAMLPDEYKFRLNKIVNTCATLDNSQLAVIEKTIDNLVSTSGRYSDAKAEPKAYIYYRLDEYILPHTAEQAKQFIYASKFSPMFEKLDMEKQILEYVNSQLGIFQKETNNYLKATLKSIATFQPSPNKFDKSELEDAIDIFTDDIKRLLQKSLLDDPAFLELIPRIIGSQERINFRDEILKKMKFITKPYISELKKELKNFLKKSFS